MSTIYIHAGAVAGGVNELKSLLLQLMHPMKPCLKARTGSLLRRQEALDPEDFHRRWAPFIQGL